MPLDKQDHTALTLWAVDCAEHVLAHFEAERPDDDRPRKAVEAGRAWARGEITMGAARTAAFASHAAAREAGQAAARAAARAAGHAAATAHVPTHAQHAATYAVNAATHAGAAVQLSAEGAPAYAVAPTDAGATERAWQVGHLPEHLRTAAFPAKG
ncbi:putative immunity protein [Streptomyces sp. NPDC059578]|uniref:putative immunity protein n=1 Tax=unclassified Streptomyces TaxID=2593676 RepID=UPI003657BEBA